MRPNKYCGAVSGNFQEINLNFFFFFNKVNAGIKKFSAKIFKRTFSLQLHSLSLLSKLQDFQAQTCSNLAIKNKKGYYIVLILVYF